MVVTRKTSGITKASALQTVADTLHSKYNVVTKLPGVGINHLGSLGMFVVKDLIWLQ